jgi:biopolymer transport protein ExbD
MLIRDDSLEDESALNITPLIDVVFLLLIFFMVATTYAERERAMELELPRAESGTQSTELPDELVLNVFRDGRVVLGDREVDGATLRASLAEAAGRNRDMPVTSRGDAHVEHARIVAVMDACAQAGLSNLSVGTLALASAEAAGG